MERSTLVLAFVVGLLLGGCGGGDEAKENDDLYSLTCGEVVCHGAMVYNLAEADNADPLDCEWDCVPFHGKENRYVLIRFRRDNNQGVPISCWEPETAPTSRSTTGDCGAGE